MQLKTFDFSRILESFKVKCMLSICTNWNIQTSQVGFEPKSMLTLLLVHKYYKCTYVIYTCML